MFASTLPREKDLIHTVKALQSCRKKFDACTLEELVDPVEEQEIGEGQEIIEKVYHEEAVARGEIMEIDEESEEPVEMEDEVGLAEIM